ncbi:protease I [Sphingomonas zeicaulis]|uniref:type 1 glutamine amidotransferase domain-containing protein n=1 Tax=Sphingomonas zeicaulis TaxID=1632740 RepID=UPI003D212E5D
MTSIADAKILILATDGFEQVELFGPREALIEAGATVQLASPKSDPIQGMQHHEKGDTITPDLTLDGVDASSYDALLLPGGVANPDELRTEAKAIEIIKQFVDAGKPVAAICHAPWLLAEADVIGGLTVTGWPSVRTDLANAGAEVVDREVVVDRNIITSRNPDDVPAFSRALIQAVSEAQAVPAE